ncbi:hypothetical protein [Bacillus sp. 491mf]|uniref:hypothetical protein n=1 Tax=Bacillus sp. 491mf TaxID=1761755 RepID=UPI001C435FA2|nr:hypothetical protein [Bacillus sp. 491mf]
MDESIWLCIEAAFAFFCHMPGFKQKEQASSGHVVFCIAVISVLKNQVGFIYYNKKKFVYT